MIRNDDGTQTNRYDSKENWLKVNPVLAQGEFVVEFDNGGFSVKVGDGNTAYKDLKYVSGLNASYPVGSIYMTMDSVNPNSLFGGLWELVKDRFLVGAGNSYQVGNIGGEASHTLTVDAMHSHSHDYKIFNNAYGKIASSQTDSKQGKFMGAIYNESAPNAWLCGINKSIENHIYPTGNNQPHNNLPPYLAVFIWARTS